jgi:simple sugar transport system permease protein/ribose transport system permease protein
VGVAIGAFFLTAVRSELGAVGAPADWYVSFVGLVLILSAILNVTLQRRLAGLRPA